MTYRTSALLIRMTVWIFDHNYSRLPTIKVYHSERLFKIATYFTKIGIILVKILFQPFD